MQHREASRGTVSGNLSFVSNLFNWFRKADSARFCVYGGQICRVLEETRDKSQVHIELENKHKKWIPTSEAWVPSENHNVVVAKQIEKRGPSPVTLHTNEKGKIRLIDESGDALIKFASGDQWVAHWDFDKLCLVNKPKPGSKFPTTDIHIQGDFAVFKNLPEETLNNMTVEKDGASVCQIWYNQKDGTRGMPVYEEPQDDMANPDVNYARLVSLNSFSCDLAWALLTAHLTISKKGSSLYFLLASQFGVEGVFVWNILTILFVISMLFWIAGSAFQVRKELVLDFKSVGDFALINVGKDGILKTIFCSSMETSLLFLSLVFMAMLNIPLHIRGAPALFHPRKASMPFAALKCDGRRMWVLGWNSKGQYEYEQLFNNYWQYPSELVLDPAILALQVYIAHTNATARWTDLITFFFGFGSLVWNLNRIRKAWTIGPRLRKALEADLESQTDEDKQFGIQKTLCKFFHEELSTEVLEKMDKKYRPPMKQL